MLAQSRKPIFVFTLILCVFLSFNPAWAQESAIQIQRLEIQILPEYDTPDILVINTIEFKNTSNQDFSGELKWKVPKGSNTHIVSDNNQPEKHLQFGLTAEENFDVMTWKLPSPIKPGEVKSVHLEYYYNNLQGSPDKTFSFEFVPDYQVSKAEVYVIQPITATNFKLTPDFGAANQSDKFKYFYNSFIMSPDNGIKIEASYTKTDPNPSLSKNQQMGGTEQSGEGQGLLKGNTIKYLLAAVIGGIILLLIYRELRNRNAKEHDFDDEEDEIDEEDQEESEEDYEQDDEEDYEENIEDSLEEDDEDYEEVKNKPESPIEAEKRKLEEALKDGRISESDYLEMLAELEEEE